MKTKNVFLKTLLTSLVLSTSLTAVANEANFKVAIIGNAQGSKEILSGDFNNGIESLTKTSAAKSSFENSMGLCAVYIKTKDANKSESACSTAIDSANSMNWRSKRGIYLKSLSYSNRGISRYLNNDIAGAIDDLTMAITIDTNEITRSNLIFVTKSVTETQDSNIENFTD